MQWVSLPTQSFPSDKVKHFGLKCYILFKKNNPTPHLFLEWTNGSDSLEYPGDWQASFSSSDVPVLVAAAQNLFSPVVCCWLETDQKPHSPGLLHLTAGSSSVKWFCLGAFGFGYCFSAAVNQRRGKSSKEKQAAENGRSRNEWWFKKKFLNFGSPQHACSAMDVDC